jgi:GAF domain
VTDLATDFMDGVKEGDGVNPTARPGAGVAEIATIELRRIADVLQVDHASLFLAEVDDPDRASTIAATGIPVAEALPEYDRVVARVLATGRVQEVHHVPGDPRGARSALATPLLDERRPIGALLVVTLREIRRLGLFEAQVLGRATDVLVGRIIAPGHPSEPHRAATRFGRVDSSPRSPRGHS